MSEVTDRIDADSMQDGDTLLTGTSSVDQGGADLGKPDSDTPTPSVLAQTADGAQHPGDVPNAPQVPDTYELKVPEGVELDREMLDRATPVFKELKLTADQAQKLSDLYATRLAETNKAQFEAWNATLEGWREASSTDSEIGGSKFAENVSLAKTALDRFGTPELKTAMDQYGMGNHPELIRLLWRVGSAMQQDKLLAGDGSVGPVDPGKILYPNMK